MLFVKVGLTKAGRKYHALVFENYGFEKTLTFDVELILFVTGWSYDKLLTTEIGKHKIF